MDFGAHGSQHVIPSLHLQKVKRKSSDLVYVHGWILHGGWEKQLNCIVFNKSPWINLTSGEIVDETRQGELRSFTHLKSSWFMTDEFFSIEFSQIAAWMYADFRFSSVGMEDFNFRAVVLLFHIHMAFTNKCDFCVWRL